MKLSTPIFQLKRRARQMARKSDIPLHQASDAIARSEGFAMWSMLSSRVSSDTPSTKILSCVDHGDLLLIAGRPGHGKTTLGLQLLINAAKDDREALLFTLELTEKQAKDQLILLGNEAGDITDRVQIITSDEISADYISQRMSRSKLGTLAVVDYLQLLDQQRSKPALAEQVKALREFAKRTGVVLAFISQIDRSFDPENKRIPDIHDIRLPNAVDLGLFTKACFVHAGEIQLQHLA